ncbi:MAG: c-type cytochrome [Phycisphaerae bacterium]|nr:c-type cytochrome [Tepidisphaeraceae bacterium]
MDIAAALVAAALAGPLACEREDCELRVDPSDAEPSLATRTSGLYPGPHAEDPSHLVRTALAPRPLVNQKNERNAYALSEGKRLYSAYNCRGCHANGGGGMGPALMDDGWIYGGKAEQIVETIVKGRPGGMPAFGGRIPEFQVRQIAAFVRSLSGNVAGDAAPSRDTRGHLGGWVIDPQSIKPGTRMPQHNFAPEDLHALLDYLQSLK